MAAMLSHVSFLSLKMETPCFYIIFVLIFSFLLESKLKRSLVSAAKKIIKKDYYNQTQESANMLRLGEASLLLEYLVSRANLHGHRTQVCLWISKCVSTTIYWYCTTSDGYNKRWRLIAFSENPFIFTTTFATRAPHSPILKIKEKKSAKLNAE